MPRPSKIDKLPPEIRDKIGDLRDRGYSLDEIMEQLGSMPIDPAELPSRSGLGRHIQGLAEISERLRKNKIIAEALIRQLGSDSEGRSARLNIQIMHASITEFMMAVQEGRSPDPKALHDICKSLDHLARAQKSDADLTLRLRQETEKKTKDAAAKAVDTMAHERGLSRETVEAIKSRILGVKIA